MGYTPKNQYLIICKIVDIYLRTYVEKEAENDDQDHSQSCYDILEIVWAVYIHVGINIKYTK